MHPDAFCLSCVCLLLASVHCAFFLVVVVVSLLPGIGSFLYFVSLSFGTPADCSGWPMSRGNLGEQYERSTFLGRFKHLPLSMPVGIGLLSS